MTTTVASILTVPARTGSVHTIASIRKRPRLDYPVTEHLLSTLADLPPGHPDRAVLRARAIVDNLPLANRLARRYAGRGECLDDLVQVAALALVKAVDGFDPVRGAPFVGYAVPTILGAIKRHFRDTAWTMRVPRSSQQLVLDLPAAIDDLAQRHGRYPTTAELADHLHVKAGALRSAVGASQVYRLPSLNAPHPGDGGDLIDLLGAADPRYDAIDERLSRVALRALVTALPRRDRDILTLRFRDEMTQADIAAEIGISQMHVSRLLKQTLAQLRVGLLTSDRGDGPLPRQIRRPA